MHVALVEPTSLNINVGSLASFYKYIDKRTSGVDSIIVGDNLISDSYEKANALNDHYLRVCTRDNAILPIFTPKMPPDSLIDVDITDQDIIRAIKKIEWLIAPGLDGISPIFVKSVFSYLVKPLKSIFVSSLFFWACPLKLEKKV